MSASDSPVLATTTFEMADQEAFAALSGDCNPLHLDPVAARREMLGVVVVHGIHGLLRLLEAYAAKQGLGGRRIEHCAVRFSSAMELGRELAFELRKDTPERTHLRITHAGKTATDVKIRWRAAEEAGAPTEPPVGLGTAGASAPSEARVLEFEELAGRRGRLPFDFDPERFARAFPALAAQLPSAQCAEFLMLTRLVGMECPGLRSIFSSFELRSPGEGDGADGFEYEVTAADVRFSLVKMRFAGPMSSGTIDAFYRPAPKAQADMRTVMAAVGDGAFAEQRALILGGSRGLGEVAAKLIAAGGGHPVVSYHSGREEAEALVAEIRGAGRSADCLAWSVDDPAQGASELARLGLEPTHLYHFASPKIFVKKNAVFERALYEHFARFYVSGFFDAYQACRAVTAGPLVLVCPSSVALDEPVRELAEYIAAKTAGEALARHLERFEAKVGAVVRRLPRIETDQTTTLTEVPASDALTEMKSLVSEAQERWGQVRDA